MSAAFENDRKILVNPASKCPPEILAQQVSLKVRSLGFDAVIHEAIIEVNKYVADEIDDFFKKALELHFPIEKVVVASDEPYHWDDDLLMAANTSSGFNYRQIAGSSKLSLHSRGLAFDINTRLNPYIRFVNGSQIVSPKNARWRPEIPGTLAADHPLVQLMIGYGWEWGGSWTKERGMIDYQHFQKEIADIAS